MECEYDSETTKKQKELVDKLSKKIQYLEAQRHYLSKFVMNEENADSPLMSRANEVLGKLKTYINTKKDELTAADSQWLIYQLDDLEAEICPKPAE